jgi:YYY domain-containing protein
MTNTSKTRTGYSWIYDLLFLLVLALAAYLRLTGVDWGEGQGQHPDENFFSSVYGSLRAHQCKDPNIPVEACPPEQQRWISFSNYLNSDTSTLNPYNRGFSYYVYGNLPMTITRVVGEAMSQLPMTMTRIFGEAVGNSVRDAIGSLDGRLLGRQLSALIDLFTIVLLYLVVARMYGRGVGLLASLFSALAAMQIQQSHFFTPDLYVNVFEFLAILFAVKILTHDSKSESQERNMEVVRSEPAVSDSGSTEMPQEHVETDEPQLVHHRAPVSDLQFLITNPLFFYSIGFGIAYGMALASKINIFPLAILLPGAFILRHWRQGQREVQAEAARSAAGEGAIVPLADRQSPGMNYWTPIMICLVAGGLAAIISFRIFQPYAFKGLGLNPQWVANIREQRAQANGNTDVPWELQWARRSHFYSFENLTVWGLGLPLGILAWIGFLYMGWRILKGEWQHALLWGWTALYFTWQSFQFNPTMRYQLPIYPLLAMMAAWFVFQPIRSTQHATRTAYSVLRTIITLVVIALTAAWAFAFHSIYIRDEPRVAASRWIYQNVPGPLNVQIETAEDGTYNQPLPFSAGGTIDANAPYTFQFSPMRDGQVTEIFLPHVADQNPDPTSDASTRSLSLVLSEVQNPTPEQVLAQASATVDPSSTSDPRGAPVKFIFEKPVQVSKGISYSIGLQPSEGVITLRAAAVANETDYDYGLPMRVDGYDGFGGIYSGELTLQVYWTDDADKLERFVSILDQTDYILIPTNHQYAQISRVPERYPLTAYYYRELMGCPPELETIPCYHEAKPGDYKGKLGFDLAAVFETFPKLGNFEINDEYAEEAFTFYDHPKVLIFKKNADFDAQQVRASLGTVDLTKAIYLRAKEFADFSTLLLPPERLAGQRAGGTWSDLFDYDWIQNRYPVVGLLIWYVFIFILGLATYPIIRIAMPGLADNGYPLSRALGLVLFGYLAWLAGSAGVPVTRTTVAIVFGGLVIIGAALAYRQRAELSEEWRTRRNYFLMVEGLFLLFFFLDLIIRLGNPDLWHNYKGGERPMNFSYFNAVIKSATFPPYDPWFAGGHINYYYYGYVLVGMPVKLLGIVPSIAYNFILPTLFAIVGICAFSIGWNLISNNPLSQREIAKRPDGEAGGEGESPSLIFHPSSFFAGLSASFLTILLGNLGTIQLLYNKLQNLGSQGTFTWESTFPQRLTWAIEGLKMLFGGAGLSISNGDWYWDPSRVVPPGPGNAITEFPLFTFLYSDLHAHMIVMAVALLAISWALSVVAGRAWTWTGDQADPAREADLQSSLAGERNPRSNRWASALFSLLIGSLVIGAAYPTNLSDAYTYLLIGVLALVYSIWRYAPVESVIGRIGLAVGAAIALYVLSTYLYLPYRAWYAQAYSALGPWKGPFTPLASYFTHWGLFLFIIVSWMSWETREWMAQTPLSALRKLKPYQLLIAGALIGLVVVILATQYIGTSVGWIALPIAAWAGLLLLNPKIPDTKRLVLFLIGTALFITVLVEVVVVQGDIGRQNTIFKFYMQAWLMLAVSAGAALAWILPAFFQWLPGWRAFWQTGMILLIGGAAMFTVSGAVGKIRDRWIPDAPHSLDSMTFMKYAHYDDFGQQLDLSEDYRAIRWLQDHVQGSPVIVEANCSEYRWCTRFTIYTGLPGVVGWNFHQRQQRVFTSRWVEERVAAVGNFYNSLEENFTSDFLETYDVKYIIVGQLERAAYTPAGIAKFDQWDGDLWKSVYRDGQTTIYEVMP